MSRFLMAIIALALPLQLHAQAAAANPLKVYGDMIVGRWVGEVTWAVDYPGVGKKGDKVASYFTCRWVADGKGIECEDMSGQATGIGLTWWDPTAKVIRTAGMDSGGNWSQGTVTVQGNKVIFASTGSLADGRKVEYKGENTFTENGNAQVSAGATILAGVSNPFRDTYRRIAK